MRAERGPRFHTTAADVAAEAGVSSATVSLVVNGRAAGRVSLVTQRKVHEAVAKLGYQVDAFARGLATGRRGAVALVTPDIADPFFSQVAMGVAHGLRGRYQLILVATGDPAAVSPPLVADLAAMRVDGILIESTAAELLDGAPAAWPIVLLDAPGHSGQGSRVDFDVASGATALARHLVTLGHRSIGYLDWINDSPTFRRRRRALVRTFAEAKADVHVARSRIEITAGAAAFERSLAKWHAAGVSAVVCATDLQAYGVLKVARERGLRVPDELSVAGFNDLDFSQVADPPLTSVSLPAEDLGIAAADVLCDLIGATASERQVTLPTHLVVRASTGPAVRGAARPVQS